MAGATGLVIVPILTGYFGLTFEQAVSLSICVFLLDASAPLLFGEPFVAGWITPVFPLVLSFVMDQYSIPSERFQVMTALSIDIALLLFVLGFTGLGKRFIDWLPRAVKGGILMGAAIASLQFVFTRETSSLQTQPVSTIAALSVCALFLFSAPFALLLKRHRFLEALGSLGLLPGFVAAAVIGPLLGEIVYDISWGIMVPPLGELWQKASPLAIGWPSPKIFLECLPLALIGYIILFGDLVTGLELTREAQSARSDEKLEFNTTRTHYSTGIRNALSAIVAPFFPSQGILFSGPQVVVLQEWRRGRESMDSLFDGLSSYWLLGPPILYLFLPVVTFIKPLMPVALTLALLISGFAVAYVAMAIPRTPAERGVAFVTGIALTVYEPWIGLLLGVVATFALVGKKEAVVESARRE